MKVSRETFLKVCGSAVLTPCLEASPLAAAIVEAVAGSGESGSPGGRVLPQETSAALYRPHLNTRFVARSASGAVLQLVLAEVTDGPVDEYFQQFSLTFRATASSPASDGIYSFHHAGLGAFDLFIVPIGPPNHRRTIFQACLSSRVAAVV